MTSSLQQQQRPPTTTTTTVKGTRRNRLDPVFLCRVCDEDIHQNCAAAAAASEAPTKHDVVFGKQYLPHCVCFCFSFFLWCCFVFVSVVFPACFCWRVSSQQNGRCTSRPDVLCSISTMKQQCRAGSVRCIDCSCAPHACLHTSAHALAVRPLGLD